MAGTTDEEPDGEETDGPDVGRRRTLGYVDLAALVGSGAAGAWYVSRPAATPDGGDEEPSDGDEGSGDAPEAEDGFPAVVRRYAPDLYFGALEKWFPTDPRPYVVDTDQGSVVDGFSDPRVQLWTSGSP